MTETRTNVKLGLDHARSIWKARPGISAMDALSILMGMFEHVVSCLEITMGARSCAGFLYSTADKIAAKATPDIED